MYKIIRMYETRLTGWQREVNNLASHTSRAIQMQTTTQPTAPTKTEQEIREAFERLGLGTQSERQRVLDQSGQNEISHPKTFRTSLRSTTR